MVAVINENSLDLISSSTESTVLHVLNVDSYLINTTEGEIEVSQEMFVPTMVNAGTEFLLTIQDEVGEITHFYTEDAGWVTPIEVNRNPENPDNYPTITQEDIESGRLRISEALVADKDPFSEQTVVPTSIAYIKDSNSGETVIITRFEGELFMRGFFVNNETDYKNWFAYYNLEVEGEDSIKIGSLRIRSKDDEPSSIFWHLGFGGEWTFGDGDRGDLLKYVFKVRETNDRGWNIHPLIIPNRNVGCNNSYSFTGEKVAACSFYGGPENVLGHSLEDIQFRSLPEAPGAYMISEVSNSDLDLLEKRILVPLYKGVYLPEYYR